MAAWSPSDLATLGAWYDPSDSGARTITSSAFEALDNKEGTASRDVAQSTSGKRPALSSAAINGLDAMDFDGTDDFLTHDNGWMYGAGTVTIGIIVKGTRATDRYLLTEADSTATASIYSVLKNSNTGTEYGPAAFIRNSSSTVLYAHNQHASIDFLDSPEATHLITLVDTGSNLAHYVDGVSANSVAYTRSGSLTHNRFAIGALYRSTGTAAHWDGLVGEIVIATTTAAEDREKIEGYLAHKWGTAGLLDAGHPYKSAAPTTGVEGTAAGGLTIVGAATGTRTVTGAAASGLMASGAVTGTKTVTGTATVALAIAGSATGTNTVIGAAATDLTFSATAAGTVQVAGTAASVLAVTGATAGTRTVLGAATAALEVAGHASGSTLGEVQGTAASALTVAGAASGTRTVTATATASLAVSAATTGTVAHPATAAVTLEVAATAAGTVTVGATAETVLTVVAAAVGLRTVLGSAAAALEMAGVAAGTVVSDDAVTRRVRVTLGARSSTRVAGADTGRVLVRLNDG